MYIHEGAGTDMPSTIIVLVDFPDKKMADGKVKYFNDLFFGPTKSVNEFYHEASGGAVSFSGEVIGPFTLPRKMTEYANGESGIGDAEPNSQTMAKDTIEAIRGNHDLSSYDNNGNGLVDAFVVVHAGSGAEMDRDKNKIWSIQYYVDTEPIKVGDVGIYGFLTIPEDALLGVTVHELGHLVFSWPDLYDGDSSSAGLGSWCLMAGGSWLTTGTDPRGSKPCHPSAWCKSTQGWVDVVTEKTNRSIKLADVKESRTVHRLWTNGAGGHEYFLIENRQKQKYDAALPGSGLLVWHVDENVKTNTNESHYKVALMQADGKNQLAALGNRGDDGDPFPGSTANRNFTAFTSPNSRSYQANSETQVSITNISDSAPTMDMDVTVRGPFFPVYQQGDPGSGIAGYDLRSPRDLVFPYDYAGAGNQNHLVLYRPGSGAIFIVRLDGSGGVPTAVYKQGDPGSGIGGYDLKSASDRGFAFDYDGSGKSDHLVFYRPGKGAIYIIKRTGSNFTAVYKQGDPGQGIGGYDLRSADDRIFAFDYTHSGKQDHLAIYRPGTGTFWILQNNRNGTFTPVYQQGDPGQGIGGYDLRSKADRAFAFDWDKSGKLDHIALYRPGTGTFWVLRNGAGGKFSPVFNVGDPGSGIGGYDLKSGADVAFAFDWTHSGRLDHVAFYRPGTGTFWVVAREGSGWKAVHSEGDPGKGIGGYDLKSVQDKVFAVDYKGNGKMDSLVCYRTNASGTIWILRHV